jgi:hypothetical protein
MSDFWLFNIVSSAYTMYYKMRCVAIMDGELGENDTITGIANLPDEVQAILIRWILHS